MNNLYRNFAAIATFFLLCCFSAGQDAALSENISITLKDGSLHNALQQISDLSGVRFAYRQSILEGKQAKAVIFNGSLETLLNKLILKNGLCYTFQNRQIIIHTQCLPKFYTISGTIYDTAMNPLPFVSVSVAGQNAGTIADIQGYFEIEAEITGTNTETLVFSSMGYLRDSIIVEAGKNQQVHIIMEPKTYFVPEVVVTHGGYFTQKIGNTRDREIGSLYLDTHGQQTALYIENRKKKSNGQLISVQYYLSDEGNTDAPFRIRIYYADSLGMPASDIIEDAIVVKPSGGKGWFSLKIDNQVVNMPENGLFIAIEGVYPGDFEELDGASGFIDIGKTDGKINPNNLSYGQRIGYNRKCRKETWHYSLSKVWFQLPKQSFGVMIAAVVKYEKDTEKEKKKKNE
ncbi:MAG: carboxypeptidase-like regulatory domain-containing protein [Bacteroidales bacterium]|nr:carboxypeptidase-like regulatory domain-containing protein [Bacteroidales bacterium]